MPMHLNSQDANFAAQFEGLLATKREISEDVDAAVADIIADVVARGDQALVALSQKFDRFAVTVETLRIGAAEVQAAHKACTAEEIEALSLAKTRIEAFHRMQVPKDHHVTDAIGVEMGWRWTPVSSVGLYVPGGTASYPSSVLMNAVPAKVAGVERIVMVVPTPDGAINPLVLVAADLAGIDEVYRIGGAQAIAALAYGTPTIAPVAKIVGPGNAYVAAAKRRVFGHVGIDMIAGPSEVVVVADASAHADWVAADLLAQAEHDTAAQAILITDSPRLAADVSASVEKRLAILPRRDIAAASWRDYGAIITIKSLDEAPALIDRLAPEHLELAVAEPKVLAMRVRNAGAIFLGHHTPEAIGDYIGGPNHVLPTARSARFSSGLSVLDFMKRTSLLACSPDALAALALPAMTLARSEALEAHAQSIAARSNLR